MPLRDVAPLDDEQWAYLQKVLFSQEPEFVKKRAEMADTVSKAIEQASQLRVQCEAGCTNGIFYFTGEEKLEDSQPCGTCNGKGWIRNGDR